MRVPVPTENDERKLYKYKPPKREKTVKGGGNDLIGGLSVNGRFQIKTETFLGVIKQGFVQNEKKKGRRNKGNWGCTRHTTKRGET